MDKTIHKTLCFPPSILMKHMACANYAQANYNAALGLYLNLGDAEAAMQTFCDHLCPLYFGSPALISKLQIERVQRDTMRQSRDASLRKSEGPPPGYKYTGQRLYIEHILTRLQQVYLQRGSSTTSSQPSLQGTLFNEVSILKDFLGNLDDCCILFYKKVEKDATGDLHRILGQIASVTQSVEQAKPTLAGMNMVFHALTETMHRLKGQLNLIGARHQAISDQAQSQRPQFLSSGFRMMKCEDENPPERAEDMAMIS